MKRLTQTLGKMLGSRGALVLLLALSVGAVAVESRWGLDLTPGIQVLLTGVLVWVTWSYTRATVDLAETAREQLVVSARDAELAARLAREAPVRQLWELSFNVAETLGPILSRLDLAAKGDWVGLGVLADNREELAEQVSVLRQQKHQVLALGPLCPTGLSELVHRFADDSTVLEAVALHVALAAGRLPDQREVDAKPPSLDDLKAAWETLLAQVQVDNEWDKYVDGTYIARVEASLKDMRLAASSALAVAD